MIGIKKTSVQDYEFDLDETVDQIKYNIESYKFIKQNLIGEYKKDIMIMILKMVKVGLNHLKEMMYLSENFRHKEFMLTNLNDLEIYCQETKEL
jgi:hypothetical protein